MKLHRSFLPFLAVVSLTLAGVARAGEGTPRPPCGQTLWVAGASTEVVVHPGAGQAISVPLKIVPYVDWNPTNGTCAAPVAGTLSVLLKCNPHDGSDSVFVGPMQVPVGVPAAPGVQDLLTGPGATPETGGPYDFPIGADVLAEDKIWRCTVTITYTLTFSGGVGTGVLTASRQTLACIVPPAPTETTIARLGMQLVDTGEGGLVARRRGDEAAHQFVLLNNDADHGVDLTFSSFSFQVARWPSGVDTSGTFFSLASTEAQNDAFPLRFADLLDQGAMVPEGNPKKAADTTIERTLHLGPCDVAVVTVLARSHGASSDGSANTIVAEAVGEFEDGSPARACACAVQWVADTAARAPLLEVEDSVTVAATHEATWSALTFDDAALLRTHAAGNLTDGDGGTRTAGTTLAENGDYPETAVDTLRGDHPFDVCTYTVSARDVGGGGEAQRNEVVVTGMASATNPLDLRVFTADAGAGDLRLVHDATAGTARLYDLGKKKKKQEVYDGLWSILVSNPPDGYSTLGDTTVRSVVRTDQTGETLLAVEPRSYGATVEAGSTPDDLFFIPLDPRTFADVLPWSAVTDDPSAAPTAATGTDQELLTVALTPALMAAFPDATIARVTVGGGDLAPAVVPIVTRTKVGVAVPESLDLTSFAANVQFTKDGKDKMTIKGTIPVTQGLNPKGATVAFAIDSLHVAFTLDKKGKAKTGKHTFELSLKKKNGFVQAGDRPFTLKLKKAELSGLFSHHFVRPDVMPPGTPVAFAVPVTAWLFDGAQTRTANVSALATITTKAAKISGTVVE